MRFICTISTVGMAVIFGAVASITADPRGYLAGVAILGFSGLIALCEALS